MKKAASQKQDDQAQENYNRNQSFISQRKRLYEALKHGPVTTIQARDELNIMSPAARIMELKEAGYTITKDIQWIADSAGRQHKSAKYYLINTGGAK